MLALAHLAGCTSAPADVARPAPAATVSAPAAEAATDADARDTPPAGAGQLLQPMLRVAQSMRALAARSASGNHLMVWDLDTAGQRALLAPPGFGYYRPGYMPPNTRFATTGSIAPQVSDRQ